MFKKDKLFFAKVFEDAVIPTKRDEDAAFDMYANIPARETDEGVAHELLLEKGKVNFVSTGVASAMPSDYYLSLNSERSSVAKHGLNVLAGTIDSGYRGEIKLMIVPLVKDVLITNMVDEVEDLGEVILYPYDRAIAQAVLLPVPKVEVEELPYSELSKIESDRGKGGWGSSGK